MRRRRRPRVATRSGRLPFSKESTEVVVAVDAPGTFQMVVRNTSTIVDSYVIEVEDPPSWLTLTHTDTNLLPEETRPVQVTLAVRPRELAVAQRIQVKLRVRSTVDMARAADVPMSIVVPPSGPRPPWWHARPSSVSRIVPREPSCFVSTTERRTTRAATRCRPRIPRAS